MNNKDLGMERRGFEVDSRGKRKETGTRKAWYLSPSSKLSQKQPQRNGNGLDDKYD